MREPEVEACVRQYLADHGYDVTSRPGRHGPDIIAKKDRRVLAVEVKGDRPGHESSPGTINVEVMTLLGQIVLRRGEGIADDLAVAIRPIHRRLVLRALPALRSLGVWIFIVTENGLDEVGFP